MIRSRHIAALSLLWLILVSHSVFAAPGSDPLPFWLPSDESSQGLINHSEWQTVLEHNLIDLHPSGINRFDYAGISTEDKQLLARYLARMQQLDPRTFSRARQKAYWINLYNALTVNLIIENYPVASITELRESFFRFGPWDDDIAQIAGQTLSLNDIEHRILRPIFRDNRIHYAVNCASLGCPNLAAQVYRAGDLDRQLDNAARDYINHPRGVEFRDDTLWVSSIYAWYGEDFGGSDKALLEHLQRYAAAPLTQKLSQYRGSIKDHYDWALNSP